MHLRSSETGFDHKQSNLKRAVVVSALAAAMCAASFAPATAGRLSTKAFGPGIDPYTDYEPQRTCSSHVQPGVAAFQRFVMNAFPSTGEGYFMRGCSIGDTSEHKDGRAWDWMVSVYNKSERRKVNRLLDWLLSRDRYGHRHARARRIGIMYIIWNRRIWAPWRPNWDPYYGSSPHTDHVHFSFSWDGALKKTTFWHRQRSMVTAAASHPLSQGLWTVTGNANVLTAGASDFHGDRSSLVAMGSTTGIAPIPSGNGYWLVKRNGKVFAYGDARHRGSFKGKGPVVDIEAAPTGQGYWIVSKAGRVKAFGSAQHYGNDTTSARIAAIAAAPRGAGYWLLTPSGRVLEFGAAQDLGGLAAEGITAVDLEAAGDQGYLIVTRRGRVWAFGAASFQGDARSSNLGSPVVAIVANPSGSGYWLVLAKGGIREFGAADTLTAEPATAPRPSPADAPLDPAPDEDLLVRLFHRSRR